MAESRGMRILRKFGRIFRAISVLLVVVVLLAAAIDGICRLCYRGSDPAAAKTNPLIEKYGIEAMRKAYPGLDDSQIEQLLAQMWKPVQFESFTQFRERPRTGRYVNVSEHGFFRLIKDQGPWPIDSGNYNVFVFGGSTTFGYGVADDQTIASHLQEHLGTAAGRPVKVYNFGRGYYYSTQERILFQELLLADARPNMAIFIDGLNDFTRQPGDAFLSDQFAKYVEANGKCESPMKQFFEDLSIARAARDFSKWLRRTFKGPKQKPAVPPAEIAPPADEQAGRPIIDRYVGNKMQIKAICEAYGVAPVFVWQPSPNYKCDLTDNPFMPPGQTHWGYVQMAEYVRSHDMGGDFLWLADIQEDMKGVLYVDAVHYSDFLCDKIAERIAELLAERGMLAQPAATAPASAPAGLFTPSSSMNAPAAGKVVEIFDGWLILKDQGRKQILAKEDHVKNVSWSNNTAYVFLQISEREDIGIRIILCSKGFILKDNVYNSEDLSVATALMEAKYIGDNKIFVDLHVNPSLNVGAICNVNSNNVECFLGAGFKWIPDHRKLAYIVWPPHFGSPETAKATLYVGRKKITELPGHEIFDIEWKDSDSFVIKYRVGLKEFLTVKPDSPLKK
ncbi:MAG: SGNH/GDSL hydrolase family protein [Planctomycetes bacterium]|nr:SGNH/GDSL hydrolase family protein [Planctomycetota bacterium]